MKLLHLQKWLSAMLAVIFVQGLHAEDADLKRAAAILLHADILTTARVGYAGTLSDKGWALNLIIETAPDPRSVFEQLLEKADTLYGKLYAVVGLYETSVTHGEYEEQLLKPLRKQNVKILMQVADTSEWVYIEDAANRLSDATSRAQLYITSGVLKDSNFSTTSGRGRRQMEDAIDAELEKRKNIEGGRSQSSILR